MKCISYDRPKPIDTNALSTKGKVKMSAEDVGEKVSVYCEELVEIGRRMTWNNGEADPVSGTGFYVSNGVGSDANCDQRTHELGQALHNVGGFVAMREGVYAVKRELGQVYSDVLNRVWHRVGTWRY